MDDDAEQNISSFYNTVGWKVKNGVTEDSLQFEDLRACSQEYVRACRLRALEHIPEFGDKMLDMASGPIQYPEYELYSKNFNKRYCVDLSSDALELAREKIGDHGKFFQGSFLDMTFEEDFFDCSISLHTIYHIDKNKQEEAVRKLIYSTKPEKPIIIIYSNPNSLATAIKSFIRLAKRFLKIRTKHNNDTLYFHAHPIEWWNTFRDVTSIRVEPWRSFDSNFQKALIPNNRAGKLFLHFLYRLESKFPKFFVKYSQYPMIILTKKAK